MIWPKFSHKFIAVLSLLLGMQSLADETQQQPVVWQTDYHSAIREARDKQQLALLCFVDTRRREDFDSLERDLFRDAAVVQRLTEVVAARLATDARVRTGDDKIRLLDHPAFAELLGGPGVAILELRDPESPHYHRVVSVFPFTRRMTPHELAVMLDLPAGSLTQRTLIWAVRTHSEKPLSTSGIADPFLMRAAANHAAHMASIRLQGHHDWGRRFAEINQQLSADLVAQEICAESWPGENLVEAAVDCVHSWRQSDGHWNAVSTDHPCFGYDMCRGTSGIWYATGIFGRRR